jgi:peptidoglycan/LPS O-acetylase OafA/YrhL
MRFKQIDVLRGIAAILVVFFHLTGSSDLSKTTATYGHYGWTGVQMFFVISGFVLPYSLHRSGYKLKNFGIFLIKRIIRIYPAYLAAIIISLILTVLTHREVASVITIISHLVFLNSILGLTGISAVFWTLAIEVQFYLLIGLAYPIVIKNNSSSLVFIIILTFFSIWAKQYTIIYWFPFFALGILIFNKLFMQMSLKVFWT